MMQGVNVCTGLDAGTPPRVANHASTLLHSNLIHFHRQRHPAASLMPSQGNMHGDPELSFTAVKILNNPGVG